MTGNKLICTCIFEPYTDITMPIVHEWFTSECLKCYMGIGSGINSLRGIDTFYIQMQ